MTKKLAVLKLEVEKDILKEFCKYADKYGITTSSFLEAKMKEELKSNKNKQTLTHENKYL